MCFTMPVEGTKMDGDKLVSAEIPRISTPDLTAHSVLAHFAQSSRSIQLLNFLMALDRVDKWTVDFERDDAVPDFEVQLLLQEVQTFVLTSAPVLHRVPREFADLLSQLTTSRCMYLVRYVSQQNSEFVPVLAQLLDQEAGGSPNIAAVRRRFEAFSRSQLLSEIFSPARLREINQIMGSYADV